jgi:hypothetical protein
MDRCVWRLGWVGLLSLLGSCTHSPAFAVRSEAKCHANLEAAGVQFQAVPQELATGVDWPIKLSGPIHGIRVYGGKKDAPTNYLDCRLALALAQWAPLLEREGVVGLQHFSMYRHDAKIGKSTKVSGHALGRAIDVGVFEMRDGRKLNVLKDWKSRARGVDPCDVSSTNDAEKIMRDLVCEASSREVFQMILTPHYDDAHKNHVHLEIGESSSSWIG